MDHVHISLKFFTMALLLARGMALLLPSTMQKLEIHYYDVLLSYIEYTKQILFYLFPYFGSVEMSDS
jgi:hypothetical protein